MVAVTDELRSVLERFPIIYFGRFPVSRRIYSHIMNLEKKHELVFHKHNVENAGSRIAKHNSTYFSGTIIDRCVRDLRSEGISTRLTLPPSVVDAMTEFAQTAPFRYTDDSAPIEQTHADDESSPATEITGTEIPGAEIAGTEVPETEISGMRRVCSDITKSKEVMRLLGDRVLCQIATRYLGYEPAVVEAYLEILSCPESAKGLISYPPLGFHYDVPGFNFLGFFFYLSDVTETTGGEHVMIRTSHRNKPLKFMLKSARTAGMEVDSYYPTKLHFEVRGPKGSGFAEDLYSFHKVNPPISQDRLTLQIRYY